MTPNRSTSSARTAAAITPLLLQRPRKVRLYATIDVPAGATELYALMGNITGNHRLTAWTFSTNDGDPVNIAVDVLASHNNVLTAEATNADRRMSGQIINRTGIQPWPEEQRFPLNIIQRAPLTYYKLFVLHSGPTTPQIFAFIDAERL